jgi:hypothetical protein
MHDLLCKACTDKGLVCSAKGRIFNNMLLCAKCTLDEGQSIFMRQTHLLTERVLHNDNDCNGSLKKKSVVVSLKRLDAKTN